MGLSSPGLGVNADLRQTNSPASLARRCPDEYHPIGMDVACWDNDISSRGTGSRPGGFVLGSCQFSHCFSPAPRLASQRGYGVRIFGGVVSSQCSYSRRRAVRLVNARRRRGEECHDDFGRPAFRRVSFRTSGADGFCRRAEWRVQGTVFLPTRLRLSQGSPPSLGGRRKSSASDICRQCPGGWARARN